MFFELHDEKKIGYKRLSDADLGTSASSNQTHIGLSEAVLTFLSDRDAVGEGSIFIYENSFDYIDAYFDRIENPDGTFRSPKIRTGDRNVVSIVTTIRDIVGNNESNQSWFLFWFGLKNEKLVFFLFNNDSEDYKNISSFGLDLNRTGTKSINASSPVFDTLMSYIERKINKNGEDELKELEIKTQIEVVKPDRKYREYDIKKANEINAQTGKQGEELVKVYLQRQQYLGHIKSFAWSNEDKETGKPYDFSFQDLRDNVIYLDVKTTGYDFNQKMIFSSQEIDFISNTPNQYCIYRVFKSENDEFLLRICDNSKELSTKINQINEVYSESLSSIKVGFKGSKLAIGPDLVELKFKPSIVI